MPLDDFLNEARKLRRGGYDNAQITAMLKQYGANADEAKKVLKELQKDEKKRGTKGF
ncbi:MAG: hypothetical protein AAFW75_08205 [Cyanobacteria bacterium J06636_16]